MTAKEFAEINDRLQEMKFKSGPASGLVNMTLDAVTELLEEYVEVENER